MSTAYVYVSGGLNRLLNYLYLTFYDTAFLTAIMLMLHDAVEMSHLYLMLCFLSSFSFILPLSTNKLIISLYSLSLSIICSSPLQY